jgi:L-threonylcarbamoyladenylate synthase
MTLELLDRFGGGLAAPSANRFGRVSPTTAAHVVDDLGERSTRRAMRSSTVANTGRRREHDRRLLRRPPQILRPGGIPTEDIVRLLDGDVVAAAGAPRASGMLDATTRRAVSSARRIDSCCRADS